MPLSLFRQINGSLLEKHRHPFGLKWTQNEAIREPDLTVRLTRITRLIYFTIGNDLFLRARHRAGIGIGILNLGLIELNKTPVGRRRWLRCGIVVVPEYFAHTCILWATCTKPWRGSGLVVYPQRYVGFLRHGREICLGLGCERHAADHQQYTCLVSIGLPPHTLRRL